MPTTVANKRNNHAFFSAGVSQ